MLVGPHLLLSVDGLGVVEVDELLLQPGDVASDLRGVEVTVGGAEGEFDDCRCARVVEQPPIWGLRRVVALVDARAVAFLADEFRLGDEVVRDQPQLVVEGVERGELGGCRSGGSPPRGGRRPNSSARRSSCRCCAPLGRG